MNLANAFKDAWKDFKEAAVKVSTVIAKEQPQVQKVEAVVSGVVAVVDPAALPVLTQFDQLEESVVGALSAAAQDTEKEPTLAALLGDLWEPFKAVVTTLKGHPSVAGVTAALNAVGAPKA